MDDIMKVVLWIIALPFIIVWYIGKWIVGVLYDKHVDRSIARSSAEYAQGIDSGEKDLEELRNNQLSVLEAELNDRAPKTPPKKMRATFMEASLKLRNFTPALNGGIWKKSVISSLEQIHYVACAKVDFSETERSFILKNNLDAVELDKQPYYLPEQLRLLSDMARRHRDDTFADMSDYARAYEAEAKSTRTISVGDFMHGMFVQDFATQHEAHTYVGKLKTQILPQIRSLMQDYGARRATETVEF